MVETVIFDYMSLHCVLDLEDSKPIFLHDTGLWWCITIPSVATKDSLSGKISSRWTFIAIFNLSCDLDRNKAIPYTPTPKLFFFRNKNHQNPEHSIIFRNIGNISPHFCCFSPYDWQNTELWEGIYSRKALLIFTIFRNEYGGAVMVGMYAIQSFQKTLQHMMRCHLTKFSCKRISSLEYLLESHILIIWSFTVTLTSKIANKSFGKTLWLMMMHYHTKFGSKRFSSSESSGQTFTDILTVT